MSINEEHFYQGTEGFLGEQKECKVLFLMKEPNSSGNKVKKNKFWFKDVVDNNIEKGEKYLSKLGQIATWLVDGVRATDNEQRKAALKKTVYINLNPVRGRGTVGTEYKDAMKRFKNMDKPDADPNVKYEYEGRWKIIFDMPDQSTIVTVSDIFNAMKSALGNKGWILPDCNPPRLFIRNRPMDSFAFTYEGKRINVLKTIHPGAFWRNLFYRAEDIRLE